LIRALTGTPVTVVFRFTLDEIPTDPDGQAVTVTATGPTGPVDTGPVTREAIGVYSVRLPASPNPTQLDVICAGEFAGDPVALAETVEVVSARLFDLVELRAADPALADRDRWPTDLLETVRMETEDEAEQIMARSFFRRYRTSTVIADGNYELWVDSPLPIRQVVSAAIAGEAVDVSAVRSTRLGAVTNPDGWPSETDVSLSVVYGEDRVPTDIRRAAIIRARTRLFDFNSGIPDRATGFTAAEGGGTYMLATPGRAGWETGIPEVDAVYKRHSYRIPGVW